MQDPNQAEHVDMPMSLINNMEVDYVVTLEEIGPLFPQIFEVKKDRKHAVPKDVLAESKIAEHTAVGIADVKKLNVVKSIFACPDCGGGLWEVQG